MREQYLLYHLRNGNLAAGDELRAAHASSLRRYLGHIIGEAEAAELTEAVIQRGITTARWSETEQSFRNILMLVSEDAVREHISKRCAARGLELRSRSRKRDRLWREALTILPLELQVVVELCSKHVLPVKSVADILGQPLRAIHRKLTQANALMARIQEDLRTRQRVARVAAARLYARADKTAKRPAVEPSPTQPVPAVPSMPMTGSAVLNQIQHQRSP